ncbi:CAP domain-containing protein [Caulobacter soli]|uniref:CAP domain-containing protein n=1 Tax=Caulobacter soli TaxID=2708539 RepID=UPI0013EDAB27|nr:CAP domain-containing protein [Caulobacter soli]
MRLSGLMALAPAIAGLLFLAPAAQAASARLPVRLDDAVLDELNFARARPAEYARELRRELDRSDDPAAVEDAIDFLERQAALPPLEPDRRVAAAARQHTQVQGAQGSVGHGAAGALGQRLRGQGVWAGLSAENISYGYDDPRDVVRQLIIDSGVPGRGHRRNIFATGYQLAGVACGAHRAYGYMCVIDFAGALPPRE